MKQLKWFFPSCAVRYAWISTKNQSKNWMKYSSLQTLCVQKNKLQCCRNRLKIAFAIGTIIMFIHHIGLFLNHRFIFVFLSLSICCDFNLAWNESHANENHFRTYRLNSICCLRYVELTITWLESDIASLYIVCYSWIIYLNRANCCWWYFAWWKFVFENTRVLNKCNWLFLQ